MYTQICENVHTLFLSLSLSHTHTHTLSLSLFLSFTITHTYTTHTHTHKHTRTTHIHTHTHAKPCHVSHFFHKHEHNKSSAFPLFPFLQHRCVVEPGLVDWWGGGQHFKNRTLPRIAHMLINVFHKNETSTNGSIF